MFAKKEAVRVMGGFEEKNPAASIETNANKFITKFFIIIAPEKQTTYDISLLY